jgi:glutamate synthase (NADPH/NADH)/glutamate synthase (NADPH/NADH) large chain
MHASITPERQRPKAYFAETGDAKEVHDFATLFGFGIDGVYHTWRTRGYLQDDETA